MSSPFESRNRLSALPTQSRISSLLTLAHQQYNAGRYKEALLTCEQIYQTDAHRTDNLLLLGALHFQLRNFSECIFYNQQAIRIDPNFAEAYGNLGNALKELGDVESAIQFYLKAIKLKPRFCDAYNNLASAHMQLGQTKSAIDTYHVALSLNPNLVDAHSNLGNLYKAQGNFVEAKKCYLQAIKIKPDFAIAWSNLAGVFKDMGDLPTAMKCYQEAIRLAPEFADAHSNMGNALKEMGKLAEAKAAYQEAIRLRPDFAIAHGNLASCFYDEGDMETAIRLYKHAIQLEPNFPDAYNNLGNAYREIGNLEESVRCYHMALSLKPDHPHAYNNLGNSLKDKGMMTEAIHCYTTAIRLMPSFAAAHSNLASILKEQGKIDQAIAHYQEALRIDPKFADAYSNMGNAYKDLGKLDDAIKCYSTAIRLKPTFADAYSNLASAYKDGGRIQEAITCYRKALELKPNFPDAFSNLVHSLVLVCDWNSRKKDFKQLKTLLDQQIASALGESSGSGPGSAPVLPAVQPFHSLVYPMNLSEMQRLASCYSRRAQLNVQLLDMPAFRFRARQPRERLKIGYVSSDFGNHPLSHLMQSVFGMHDRRRFEVFCYALSPDDGSQWRRKIQSEVEHFKDISRLVHGEAARMIAGDGIHILVNLNGYTKGARNEIFALRPAPIQLSYMGFCGTMGSDSIDYMVADETVVPERFTKFYTEKLVYMPHCYFVNDHKQSARDVLDPSKAPAREVYEVPKDKIVFANFNQIYKIDPVIFSCWMRILKRVPNSIIWLLRFPPAGEANIKAAAKGLGIDPARIHFTNVAPKDEHLRRGQLADLFLDTPVCNAHTTGCDALWGGVPMITMPGEKMASRVAASLLAAAGLDDMVVMSLQEYEDKAVELASNVDKLREVRRRLSNARETCPLFDTERWVRNLEEAYDKVWQRYADNLEPDHIKVMDVRDGDRMKPITEQSRDTDPFDYPDIPQVTLSGTPTTSTPSVLAAPAGMPGTAMPGVGMGGGAPMPGPMMGAAVGIPHGMVMTPYAGMPMAQGAGSMHVVGGVPGVTGLVPVAQGPPTGVPVGVGGHMPMYGSTPGASGYGAPAQPPTMGMPMPPQAGYSGMPSAPYTMPGVGHSGYAAGAMVGMPDTGGAPDFHMASPYTAAPPGAGNGYSSVKTEGDVHMAAGREGVRRG